MNNIHVKFNYWQLIDRACNQYDYLGREIQKCILNN